MDEPREGGAPWHAHPVDHTPVDAALRQLTDFTRCPACATPLTATRCPRCGLELGGADGVRLAAASRAAARALADRRDVVDEVRARQGLVGQGLVGQGLAGQGFAGQGLAGHGAHPGPAVPPAPVPPAPDPGAWTRPVPVSGPVPHASGPVPSFAHPGPPASGPVPGPTAPPAAPRAFDVARLFALAGAGMVAAAALVFAFFVLGDSVGARAAVLLVATAGAAAGTLALRRSALGSSAEAVGGLVAALAVVDALMIAQLATGPARWLVLASLLLVVGVGLPAAGLAARVRAWTVTVLVLPAVPLCVAAALAGQWAWVLGLLAAALVTLVRAGYRRAVAERFGASGAAVDALLALAALVLVLVALVAGLALPSPVPGWDSCGVALAVLLTAVVVRLQAPADRPAWGTAAGWLWAAGGLAVLAAAAAVVELPAPLGTVPLAAAAAWAALVLAPRLVRRDRDRDTGYRAQVAGGWTALVLTTGLGTLVGVAGTLAALDGIGVDGSRAGTPRALDPGAFGGDVIGGTAGPVLAVLVLAGALAAIGRVRLAPVAEVRPAPFPAPGAAGAGPVGVGGAPVGAPAPTARATAVPAPTGWRPHAAVVVGAACLPAAVVLAVWVAAGLARPSAVGLLLVELLLAGVLVELGRRAPSRREAPSGAWRAVPRGPWRGTLTTAASAQLAFLALLTWASRPTAALGAVVVVVLLLRARGLVTRDLGGVLVALAATYAGAVLATLLVWAGWDGFGVVGGVAVALLAAAVLLTVLPRVGEDTWLAVLVVALVPAVLAVAAVAVDRTWWGAGAAAALLALEAVLLAARGRAVPAWARVLAAALLLPTLSVVVVCAGALLLPGSGSPVLLPVIAVLAAATAVTAPALADRLGGVGGSARVALELAAAGTGGVALLLGVARTPTGADTVLVLCAVLGAGATAVALRPDRRIAWWPAAVLWCGVVWSALVWSDVTLVEAYTAAPALAAVVVGTLLSRHGDRWRPLVAAGVALAVAPTLLLAVAGRDVGVRSAALLALAAVAVGVGRRARGAGLAGGGTAGRLATLAGPLLVGGAAASLAGAVRAAHLAAGTPVADGVANARLFGAALVWSLVGATLLAALGRLLATGAAARRWALAPALVVLTLGALVAVRPSWALTGTALVVELALLALAVAAVRSEAAGTRGALATDVPPGWVLWLAALAWAIAAWSPRELRVEVFALPLGLALTALGWVALRAALAESTGLPGAPVTPGPRPSWPLGRRTSIATLTPGILATLGPSMLAIWTDPMTWRAILVVVLALGFMLAGAREMLRAPLVLGAGALPVAVVSVFAAQLGRTISAGPWLLTLLAAGGLLLVLGVFAERRRAAAADGRPVAASVLR